MFGLGFTEIIVILAVALIVVGPKKLPEVARTLGKTMGTLKRTADELRREMMAPVAEIKRELLRTESSHPKILPDTSSIKDSFAEDKSENNFSSVSAEDKKIDN